MADKWKRGKVNLWQQLSVINDKYHGDNVILGKEALGFPRKTDAARCQMYNNHIDQRLTLGGHAHPDKPRVFGNFEDMYGNQSSFIRKAKEDCVIDKIIQKFPTEDGSLRPPLLIFLYYPESDRYDVTVVTDVEDMAEKYGFEYDIDRIKNYKEGMRFSKGEIINCPKCFDKFGNYGFGKNLKVVHLISTDIIEDGIGLSSEVAEDIRSEKYFGSVEVYRVKVPMNTNIVLTNMYGDKNTYKCFPDIGEHTIGSQLCTRRVINLSQILYDMKKSNMSRRLSSDPPVYVSGEVVDIEVYSNIPRDEIPDQPYNRQICYYLDMMTEYNKNIIEYIGELKKAGCNISQKMRILLGDAIDYIDSESTFSEEVEQKSKKTPITLYFTIKKEIGALKGQKMTGRAGNKGVITKIIPKELMYHLETGETVDVIMNGLGPSNRLTTMPIIEPSINFICNRAVEYIRGKSIKDKEEIIFRIIQIFSPSEYDAVTRNYEKVCTTKSKKEEYWDIVDKYGVYIYEPPYWAEVNTYEAIEQCHKEFKWLKPYDVYTYETHTKRWVKVMTPQYIGEMYFIKLKQTSKKGLSARSTGTINRKGLPDKTSNAKRFQVPYSNIPVRRGQQEMANGMMALDPEKIAIEQLAHRNSPIARKELASQIMKNYMGVEKFVPTDRMKNVNVQILGAYLLFLGIELVFEHDELDMSDRPGIKSHKYKNVQYYCTTEEMIDIIAKDIVDGRVQDNCPDAIYFGPESGYQEFIQDLIWKVKDDILSYI